ncbi:helix-turn-helix domain-containing protein [Streptomyces sp. PSKA01]|uniref:Helix-turn-helix domain-containing protein n=1 Tax=Streptomyces cupreus TaxID=2759956 RepID=A0A7X1MD07_9ACTN|nr:helix-turn-helix domain-containing protein [Streptomyces cupreus]
MRVGAEELARLAEALRELKSRTGLSLAALSVRTPFSKSSWDRYLNGKTLPPREAVQVLCRLALEPDGRCLALWDIAETEWSGRAAAGPEAADTGTEPGARAVATGTGAKGGKRRRPDRTGRVWPWLSSPWPARWSRR